MTGVAPGSTRAPELRRRAPCLWAVNLVYAACLVIAALLPISKPTAGLRVPDWLAHAAAYGVQAVLVFRALPPSMGQRRALICAWIGASLFGMATEALQLLQPARTVEAGDIVANMAGALTACVIITTLGLSGLRGRR